MTRSDSWPKANLTRAIRAAAKPRLHAGSRNSRDIRDSVSWIARSAARQIDSHWKRSGRVADGRIQVVDIFSGCGGMSAGFKSVNGLVSAYRLIGACDIDEVANTTYEANLGIRPWQEDVSRLARSPQRLHRLLMDGGYREADPLVLIGCAPCQGFSSHRNNTGTDDPRNSLFVDFARIAVRLRPDAIVVENVPELLTDRYWPLVRRVRTTLERAGYHVHLVVHNLAEFGVPQERFRALMIAMPHPFTPPAPFLSRSRFNTVRKAIGGLPPVSAGERHSLDSMHFSAGHRQSTITTIRAVPKDGGSRPEHVGPPCLRRAKARNGRAVYEDVYGRLFWDRPAITITAYARNPASGRFVHPEQDRGLTIREAALLQGFPRDYWFAGSFDHRFRQIGNAVPPVFASYIASYLLGEIIAPVSPDSDFDPGITSPVGPSFSRLIPSLKAGHRREVTNAPSRR